MDVNASKIAQEVKCQVKYSRPHSTLYFALEYLFRKGYSRQRTAKRNIETHLPIHCWLRKQISITYAKCVFVALVIQRLSRTVLFGLSGHTMFFHIIL